MIARKTNIDPSTITILVIPITVAIVQVIHPDGVLDQAIAVAVIVEVLQVRILGNESSFIINLFSNRVYSSYNQY
jgi:hypothetical protein